MAGYAEWIFMSIFFLRYVINAIEKEAPFGRILGFIGICFAVFGMLSMYASYMHSVVIPFTDNRIYRSLYHKLYAKARNVELRCFEDADFYNKYTLALDGSAQKIFSAAFQDYKVMAMSVKDNVLMGAAFENPKETAEHALQCAGVWDRVRSLPNGIDTVMTREFDSDGAVLSGGEQQKIVVARAFAQKASVKVFDEPSSAIDPIAEYHLNHSMLSAAEHKSVVFISHRLSTTRIADRIYMLENGSIIEEGSHAAFPKKGGKYAHMWSVQAGQYL